MIKQGFWYIRSTYQLFQFIDSTLVSSAVFCIEDMYTFLHYKNKNKINEMVKRVEIMTTTYNSLFDNT